MAPYGQNQIEEVRSRADIVEVIGAHVALRRSGRNFSGLCPFHQEKTPSFSVSPDRGFFYCFGCGVGGTVFDFVMKLEALSFPEALQSLARRFGVSLPPPDAGSAGAGERDALVRANQLAADFYAHVLWQSAEGAGARAYLESRGITIETARAFLLGFAPSRPANLASALHQRGLVGPGVQLGLLKLDERGRPYDMFRGRLMFPIRDAQSRVTAFGGRVLDDRLPKYINSPESPLYSKARTVYGLSEARQAIAKNDRAIVVEGYFDVIALWQAGFKETIASLGTSLTVDQLRLAARYTRNVIACFDGDSAGRRASMRALETFLEAGLLGRGVFIPQGFDPDTLVRKQGADAMRGLLAGGELLVDYFLREQATSARGSLDERARAAERVVQLLGKIANPFEFDLIARKAAPLIGVSEDLLRQQTRKAARRSGPAPARDKAAAPPKIAGGPPMSTVRAELGLIAIALTWPELRSEIAARTSPAEGHLRSLITEICGAADSAITLEARIMSALNSDERAQLSALMIGPLLDDLSKSRTLIEDYCLALANDRRRSQLQELRQAAVRAGPDDAAAMAQAVIDLRREPDYS